MKEFSVKCNMLKSQVSVLQGMPSRMNVICSNLESISSSLAGLRGLDNIPSEVHAKLADVEEYTKSLTDISQKTGDIVNLYVLTEQEIIDNAPRIKQLDKPTEGEEENGIGKIINSDLIWGSIGAAGVTGQSLSNLKALISGGMGNPADLTNFFSGSLGTFGDLAQNAFATGDDLLTPKELLFGTKIVFNPKTTTIAQAVTASWKDSLKNLGISVGKNAGSAVKTVGDGIKVATTWAGNICSGIINGMENYEEFDGEMNGRFWGETVIETAADIGLGIAAGAIATAAVAAGAAALGVAAPAVVVGVATVGITWGVNALAKTITKGKCTDFGDMIADGLLGSEEKKKKK